MYTLILGTVLAIFKVVAAGEIGGGQKTISQRRCGTGLKLWDVEKKEVWGTKTTSSSSTHEHDVYGDGTVKYTVDGQVNGLSSWSAMVGQYPGIDAACEKFNTVLVGIANDFESPPSGTNQYVSSPHSWKRAVTMKLHDAGCAISPNDDNLEQFLESFNYPHQQKLRMTKAKRTADEYVLKIQGLQDEWKQARESFVRDMKSHGTVMKSKLRESSKQASLHNYQAATDVLISEQEGSARGEIAQIRGTISKNGEMFEELAHKFKRDGLRWSKLNQISKEQERLAQMTTVIKLNSFDVLSRCLANFQKEFVD